MNKREDKVAERYQQEGWKVLRGGAPDFIMLQIEEGTIKTILAVEVKSPDDGLSYEQAIYKQVFAKAGIEFKVEIVK